MTYHTRKHALAGAARLERKEAGDPSGMKETIDALARAFEEFKAKNDGRIAEVKKGFDDVVRRDEIKRINDALDHFEALKKGIEAQDAEIAELKRRATTSTEGENKDSPDLKEYRQKFNQWLRKGEGMGVHESDLRQLEGKALSVGSDPNGGYTVLPEYDRAILSTIKLVSPFRQYARVQAVSSPDFRLWVNVHGATSGWVSELGGRTATSNSTLKEIIIPAHEIYAMPAASQSILDDSTINMEQWIADETALEFAYQEGVSFITGNGVGKPYGILSQTIVADTANLAHGSVGYYATGKSGGFNDTAAGPPATQGFDALISVSEGLKGGYRQGASWLMNRRTRAKVRQIKDLYGNYVWQPSTEAGKPATILSYPDVDMEDMPDVAANSYSVAFGNWQRAYVIVDRIGTRILRDPFSSKPSVLFYTTKRVGGAVVMHEAYKLLKFAAS